MDKPVLSKKAFWDVDMDSIDYDKSALFVMESVINNGSFCCLVFKLKPQDFIYPVKKYPFAQSTNYYGA